jgi:hypothetical protein
MSKENIAHITQLLFISLGKMFSTVLQGTGDIYLFVCFIVVLGGGTLWHLQRFLQCSTLWYHDIFL